MAVALSGYRAESLWLRCEGCGCPLPQTFRRKPPGGRVPKPSRFDRRLARMNERPKLESSKVIANVGKWVTSRDASCRKRAFIRQTCQTWQFRNVADIALIMISLDGRERRTREKSSHRLHVRGHLGQMRTQRRGEPDHLPSLRRGERRPSAVQRSLESFEGLIT